MSRGQPRAQPGGLPPQRAINPAERMRRDISAQSPPQPEQPASSSVHEEGVVTIQPASRPFIVVQEVSATKSDSMVSAPARVDFRDGAVSQVGAPLEGRVQVVHVLVGQKVRIGDPLVTLDCPDAAAMRASIEAAQASCADPTGSNDSGACRGSGRFGRDLVAAETKVSARRWRALNQAVHRRVMAAAVVVRAPIAGIIISRKRVSEWRSSAVVTRWLKSATPRPLDCGSCLQRDLAGVHVGSTGHHVRIGGHDVQGRVSSVGTVVGSGLHAPVFPTIDASPTMLRPGMYGRVEIQAPTRR
jgi:cobalt-zinc-cadmium efflux system membrane fusion protein